jgi:hypothetical protein
MGNHGRHTSQLLAKAGNFNIFKFEFDSLKKKFFFF